MIGKKQYTSTLLEDNPSVSLRLTAPCAQESLSDSAIPVQAERVPLRKGAS